MTWPTDDTTEPPATNKAALCLSDWPRCPVTEPNDAPFVYVRRHGPGGRYHGCYSEAMLDADAESTRQWLVADRDVYVYFNNDVGGHAVANARRLTELVAAGQ